MKSHRHSIIFSLNNAKKRFGVCQLASVNCKMHFKRIQQGWRYVYWRNAFNFRTDALYIILPITSKLHLIVIVFRYCAQYAYTHHMTCCCMCCRMTHAVRSDSDNIFTHTIYICCAIGNLMHSCFRISSEICMLALGERFTQELQDIVNISVISITIVIGLIARNLTQIEL